MSVPDLRDARYPFFIPRESVLEYLPPFKEVDRVFKHADGEMDAIGLLGALLSGTMELWKWDTGWAVINVWGDWIDIVCMFERVWGKGEEAMGFFQEMSKQKGLRGIRTLNARKGAARRAEQWGFKVRLIEYIREN